MLRLRMLGLIIAGIAPLCLISVRQGRTQSSLRRITNSSQEGINLNPAISGDGRIIAFESTEDIAAAGGSDQFHAIRANISTDAPTFFQICGTRAVSPAISQDGSRIAFASKDDPLGTNPDGNSEIFLFDGAKVLQVTNTSPGDIANRITNGNFQPSISDDGRFIAFSSNRDLSGQNGDGNLEIFIYDSAGANFTQLTNSSGMVGFSDAKISGNGASVAYIRDTGGAPSASRDLLRQARPGPGTAMVLVANVPSLAMTYGRAISDDGTRIVYSGETTANSSQVFLFDGRSGDVTRQITALGVRVTEVPLHPTISGDGSCIAFATRRPFTGFSNSDNSIELYTFDIPSSEFARVTNAPAEADGFDGSNRAAEVVSSLNDDASIVAFNFPRALSGSVASGLENNSEIYVIEGLARPRFGTLSAILNGASFGKEPSPIAIAPDSIAVARGSALANTTLQSQRLANGTFPMNLGGTTVTVNGRSAQIFSVSPGQVNFLVPPQTEIGNAEVIVSNPDNFSSRGTVPTPPAAPGIFTKSGDGSGTGMVLNSDTLQEEQFDPTGGNLRLTIFTTGARNAAQTLVIIGGRTLKAESVMGSPDLPGLDEVHVRMPADLRGTGTVNVSVQCDARESNPVTVTFSGDPARNIFINEVLADPPDGIAGDANHDGIRDSTQDEFVELVNATTNETISLDSWTIRTRATGALTETTRFTFAAGTMLAAGEAVVVFGGGSANLNPADSGFGCAQVLRATTSTGLSLTNSGLTILVRDGSGNLITQFSYGDATGLAGDSNQALTRSPDITGNFVPHTSAAGADGRRFSPGLRVNGKAFGTCASRLASVSMSPLTTSINVGQTTQFTAQAFDQFSEPMTGVTINFASDNSTAATADSVSMNPSTGVATATISAHNPGTAHITASATEGINAVKSSQSTLTVNGPSLSVNDVILSEGNSGTTTFTFFVSLSGAVPTGDVTFDIATAEGSATAASGDYVARSLTAQTIPPNQTTYRFDVVVNGDTLVESNETFFVNISNVFGASVNDSHGLGRIQNDDAPLIVISQIYGGGGNSGATFRNDYIELFNRGATTVDLAGWSVQQASATGTSWSVTALCPSGSCLFVPGRYFLVKEASSGSFGADLPIADVTGSSNLAATAGKIALVNDATSLTGSGCPFGASVVDFVGYGTTTDCSENATRAAAPSNSTAAFRKAGGCLDTNDNAADFLVASPNPRNSSSPVNDCANPKPDITINDVTVTEGNTGTRNVEFTVRLSAPGTETVSVDYSTADGTATAGSDYQFAAGTVSFAPGQISNPITITIMGDTVDEPPETFFINLSNAVNGLILDNQAKGTITDNDPTPALSINDASIAEGDSGSTAATFMVNLSAASGFTVTANYATADNTAAAGIDYQSTSGTIAFNPGQRSKAVTVLVNGDTDFEQNETFFVNLSTATNATISDDQGLGTITNDDAAPPIPTLSINDVSFAEGNTGTPIATFTVTLSSSSAGIVTVDYATANGTATTAGNDYQSATGTLIFNPGDTSKPIEVTINGDTLVEPDETFFVNLTNASAGASIGDSQGLGMIQNDDDASLLISQVYGGGNNSGAPFRNDFVELFNRGTTTVDFSTTPFSVQYASIGSNFGSNKTNLTSGTIKPGQYFLIQESGGTTNGVTLPAPDAAGTIAMAAASGKVALVVGTSALSAANCPDDDGSAPFSPNSALIADFVGYGGSASTSGHCYEGTGPAAAPSNTTSDFRKSGGCADANDNVTDFGVAGPFPRNTSSPINICVAATPSNLTITDVSAVEGNSGPTTATFTVSLSAPAPSTDVTFDISTQDGTATTANSDYVAKTLTNQIIPAGQMTYTFTVIINGDAAVEPDETFFVKVTNINGATIADGQGFGTIQNDDLPTLWIDDISANEGNSGPKTFTFHVTLSAPAPAPITFDIATQDNTATIADNDYVAHALIGQTIAAGEQTYNLDVTVNGDTNIETNETFFVNLTNVSEAIILDGEGLGTIQNDDSPALTIDDISATEGNSGLTIYTFHVSLSLPAGPGGVTFDIATADGTATSASEDYIPHNLNFQAIPAGSSSYTFDVTVNGDVLVEADQTFFVNVTNVSGATVLDNQGQGTIQNDDMPLLVISQVYGGGGNSSATYANDFIEIFNRGTTMVDFSITPYSVQYAGATSNFGAANTKTDINSGIIGPGDFFLIQEASGGGTGAPLPTPDASGNINLAATAGKVALVIGTAALNPVTCPGDDGISPFNPNVAGSSDFLGYGSTANCYEGSAAPSVSGTNSNARSVIRTSSCTDTNANSADFSNPTTAPTARNTATATVFCS